MDKIIYIYSDRSKVEIRDAEGEIIYREAIRDNKITTAVVRKIVEYADVGYKIMRGGVRESRENENKEGGRQS